MFKMSEYTLIAAVIATSLAFVLYVAYVASGFRAARMQTAGGPARTATYGLVVGGLTFDFAREMEFTGLAIARDPGTILVWLGAAMLAGGFMVVFFLPGRRVWARMAVGPDGRGSISLAAPVNNHFGADRDYNELVSDLRATCASPLSA